MPIPIVLYQWNFHTSFREDLLPIRILLISECNCDVQYHPNVYNSTCDNNGQCYCQAGFFSAKCEEGTIFIILQERFVTYTFFLISECNCNVQGSIDNTCDNNGQCNCKANVINEKCDACASDFVHNFPLCTDHYNGKS